MRRRSCSTPRRRSSAVCSKRAPRGCSRPDRASRLALELFCDDVLEGDVFKAQVGKHLLEPPVFSFQLLEPLDVGHFHVTIFGFPLVVCGLAHAVLTAYIGQLSACFGFFQYPYDLGLGESRFPHLLLLGRQSARNLSFLLGQF